MAQLSRPFQIALVAMLLLGAVWFFALQGHSSSPSPSSSSASSSSASAGASSATSSAAHSSETLAQSEAKAAATPTPVYHGSAPGVEGLTRAINKAHGAVATSQSNAKSLEAKSAQASGEAPSTTSSPAAPVARVATPTTSSSAAANPVARPSTSTSSASTSAPSATKSQPSKAQAAAGHVPAKQALVESALKTGKVAVILFWNPKGTDDTAVAGELRLLEAVHHAIAPLANVPQVRHSLQESGMELQKSFAGFLATASEVSAFGSITRDVQVTATPTIVIVNPHGHASVLTGLQDAYSIEQAIDEARNA